MSHGHVFLNIFLVRWKVCMSSSRWSHLVLPRPSSLAGKLVSSAGRISNNLGWPGPTTKIAPRTVRQNLPQLLLFFLDCLLYLAYRDHLLFCGLWDRFSLLPVGSKNNVQYEKKIHQHVAVIHHFPTDLASSQEIMTPPNLNQSHLHPWFVAFPNSTPKKSLVLPSRLLQTMDSYTNLKRVAPQCQPPGRK